MALTSIGKDFITQAGVVIKGTSAVTSSTAQSGALQVNSGAAIAANLIVGTTASIYGPTTLYGSLTVNQPVTVNSTLNVTGQSTLAAVTATLLSATSVTVTGQSIFSTVTATLFTATSVTVNGNESITGSLNVTGQSTLAAVTATLFSATSITVTGNETIGGSLNVTGQSTLAAVTATLFSATSLTVTGSAGIGGIVTISQGSNPTGAANGTGALQVTNSGGAAIAGQLWVGGNTFLAGDLYVDGTQFIVNKHDIATVDNVLTLSSGTTSAALASGSGLQIGNTVTSQAYATFLYDGGTTPGYWYTANGLKINATTAASSTNTGALQVAGSIGVAGGAFVGGAVTASNFIGYLGGPGAGAIGTGANLYGGTTNGLGQLVYQSNANVTAFVSSGTNGQLLYLVGGIPVWTSPSGLSAGNASTASNIAAGLKDQIPYQTNPGQTTFSAGLTFNGTTFTATNIVANSNNNAINFTSTGGGALTVVGGATVTKDMWVGGNLNVAGNIYLDGIGLDTIQGTTGTFVNVSVTGTGVALTVPNGSVTIGQNLTATTAVITSLNASTSSNSANALYVQGGVGVDKSLKVSGDTWITGNLNVQGNITGTNVVINNLTGTNAQFYGDATGNGALYAGVLGYTPFAQTMAQFTGNFNGYMEVNVQNVNTGTKSSADVVVSADNVGTNNGYIDMGITNSNWDGTQPYSLGQILSPNDGYIMVGPNAVAGNGDLAFGTTTTGTNIKFVVAATSATVLLNQLAMTINPANTIASSTNTGVLVVYGGAGIAGSMYVGGIVTSTSHIINGTTNASSTNTGALQVFGGAGIGLGLVVGGTVTATNQVLTGTTNATNTTSGALQVAGGVGIGLNVNAGGSVTAGAGFYASGTYVTALTSGIVVDYAANNGRISVNTGSNLTFYTGGIGTTSTLVLNATGVVSVPSTINASSTNSGALQVSGGAGIAGSLYVGGLVTATTFYGALTGVATTATFAFSATTATNVAGGATGSIPIQVSPGVTGFIPLGTSGYVLTAGATTATWAASSSITAGNATTATNIGGFSAQQVLFQFTPGITTATSGLTYNLNNNQLSANNLLVSGITTSSGQLVANSGAVSNGTGSGALIVAGGAGITGAVNVGGTVYAGLQSAATGTPIYTFSGGNTAFATYTSPVLAGSSTVTLDSWTTSSYRTARYVIQIVDSGKVHVTEMTVFTDWTNVYMNQYGISTNQGELGAFDANNTSTVGTVTLTFTPSPAATAMTIKVSRLGITT